MATEISLWAISGFAFAFIAGLAIGFVIGYAVAHETREDGKKP